MVAQPHLPTGETYTISEGHAVIFEQMIEEYPEFLPNMHAFFSPLDIVPACMSNFLGRFTTLLLPKVSLIRHEASCQHGCRIIKFAN